MKSKFELILSKYLTNASSYAIPGVALARLGEVFAAFH